MIDSFEELYSILNIPQEKHRFFPVGNTHKIYYIATFYNGTLAISEEIYNYILIEFCSNGRSFHHSDLPCLITKQRNKKLSKI